MTQTLITATDVAQRLNISTFRVYELIREGGLPPNIVVPLGKRQMRFKPAELEEWISTSRAREKPTEEPKPQPEARPAPHRVARTRKPRQRKRVGRRTT